jgi:hypothetical protein
MEDAQQSPKARGGGAKRNPAGIREKRMPRNHAASVMRQVFSSRRQALSDASPLHFFFFGAGMIESGEAFVTADGEAAAPSFFFFGFFTSLFPRIWPLAMIFSCCRPCSTR